MNAKKQFFIFTVMFCLTILVSAAYCELTKIEIAPGSTTLKVGQQQVFTASGSDAQGNSVNIQQPQWQEDEFTLPDKGVTCEFTATRTGHFTLTCRDGVTGIEKTIGISVIASRGDSAEVLETSVAPPARTGHSLVWLNGYIYLFGGITESGIGKNGVMKPTGMVQNDLWRLNEEQALWEEVDAVAPPPERYYHKAVAYNGKMYALFGKASNGQLLNDCHAYDPTNKIWSSKTINPPLPGLYGVNVKTAGSQWLVSGGNKQENGVIQPNRTIYSINPINFASSVVAEVPEQVANGIPVGTFYTDGVWQTGYLSESFDEIHLYNQTTTVWTTQPIPEPRPEAGVKVVDVEDLGEFFMCNLGYSTGDDFQVSETWILSVTAWIWSLVTGNPDWMYNMDIAEIPSGLSKQQSPLDGIPRQVLMFGGEHEDGTLSDETLIYTLPYEGALSHIAVTPKDASVRSGEYIRFSAVGYDDENYPTSVNPVWSATGGSINAAGIFSADEAGFYAVTAQNEDGSIKAIAEVQVGTSDVSTNPVQPFTFRLYQNHPNPFNPTTQIQYEVKEACHVKLHVFDTTGREVALLMNENKMPGKYETRFNASTLPAGVYYAKIRMGTFSEMRKMVLVK